MAPTFKPLEVEAEKPMIIRPASPTEHKTFYLSNLDQQVCFHVEMLFMYDARAPQETGELVDTVREALSQVLVPYYFAAGRIRIDPEENRLQLVCNEAGALFSGAYCNSTLADLGDLRVPNPDFRKLLVYPRDVQAIEDLPLLTFQMTRFKCGGFIVGIYVSHTIFDGISGSKFYNDIGKVARGEAISTENLTLDREVFRPRSPPRISYAHKELIKLPDAPAKLLFNPASYDISAPPKLAFKIFTFTLSDQLELKRRAMEDGAVSRCSTFEALTAHLWKGRTMALGMDPEAISKLFVVVSIRDKLDLPEGFAGNAIIASPCVDTTVEDVCKKPLSFCVRKVKQAIATATEEYVRSEIDWISVNGHGIIDLPGGMIITPWSKLPFDHVDFGCGRPTYVAPPVNDRPEYVLVLSSCKADGALDVFMAMDFHLMPKLEACLKI